MILPGERILSDILLIEHRSIIMSIEMGINALNFEAWRLKTCLKSQFKIASKVVT